MSARHPRAGYFPCIKSHGCVMCINYCSPVAPYRGVIFQKLYSPSTNIYSTKPCERISEPRNRNPRGEPSGWFIAGGTPRQVWQISIYRGRMRWLVREVPWSVYMQYTNRQSKLYTDNHIYPGSSVCVCVCVCLGFRSRSS